MRLLRIIAAVLLAAAPLLAGSATSDERPLVVVLRVADLPPFRSALEELERTLVGSAEVVVHDLSPPLAEHAFHVEALGADAVVPLGSRATTWAVENTREVPIVFGMVLNPVSSGLVRSMNAPGGRVTGAALDIPPERQFEALREVVGARRVAVLYNPQRTGPIVKEAQRAAARQGIELVGIEVRDATQLEGALGRVGSDFDALWSVADPTVLSRSVVKRILLYTLDHRIPFMGLSDKYVRAGALIGMSTSYAENGRLTAELVQRVLAGESPGKLPISRPHAVDVVFNPRTARHLKLRIEPRQAAMSLRALE